MALCIIVLCLVSCATGQRSSGTLSPGTGSAVYITNGKTYHILAPGEIETPLDMFQHISGSYGKQEISLDALVQADDTRILMVLLNGFGSTMGELFYSPGELSFSSPFFPSSFKPEYIVADFQFCFYNPQALTEALGESGLVFSAEEGQGEDGAFRELRRIWDGKKKIIEIEKTGSAVRYTNFLRNYSYLLEGAFL